MRREKIISFVSSLSNLFSILIGLVSCTALDFDCCSVTPFFALPRRFTYDAYIHRRTEIIRKRIQIDPWRIVKIVLDVNCGRLGGSVKGTAGSSGSFPGVDSCSFAPETSTSSKDVATSRCSSCNSSC